MTEPGIERTLAPKVLFVIDTLGAGGAARSLQELLPPFRAAGVQPLVACFERRTEGVESLVLHETDVRFVGNGSRFSRIAALRTDALLADHFHAITQAVKDAAVRRWLISKRKVSVVPRGPDPHRLGRPTPDRRREVRQALGIPAGAFVLLNAARQEFQEGSAVLAGSIRAGSLADDERDPSRRGKNGKRDGCSRRGARHAAEGNGRPISGSGRRRRPGGSLSARPRPEYRGLAI